MKKSAILSACGRYRYSLGRSWDDRLPPLCIVMLNPSTADAEVDDATIRKCCGFAIRQSFGSIIVVNLFAWRATKPADLKAHGFPVGEANDQHIRAALKVSADVVCAWGRHAARHPRADDVIDIIRQLHHIPKALAINADGTPTHPVRLPYEIDQSATVRPLVAYATTTSTAAAAPMAHA